MEKYLSVWRHIKPKTTGHHLKKLGIEPGVEYQRILRELRNAWLDGEIHSEQEEQEYLHGILGHAATG
jgi:tRNA nucleotidyltransferase (CCA-adding enzyme)